jgi:hypothetical protein
MSTAWRFLHYLAFTAWIGGALAAMVAGMACRRLDRGLWAGIAEAQGAIYRTLVGPGAAVSVFTGLLLTFRMYGELSGQVGSWLGTMQGLGLIAALVTLLGAMPAASRLARLEPTGDTAAAFDRTRHRLAVTGSLGGTLALLSLLAGALYRG